MVSRGGDDKVLIVEMRLFFIRRINPKQEWVYQWPVSDGLFAMNEGLEMSRNLKLDSLDDGLPVAAEVPDLLSPQFISDLVTCGAIDACTTESQSHRHFPGDMSYPVGFKNVTDDSAKVAADAVSASKAAHTLRACPTWARPQSLRRVVTMTCKLFCAAARPPTIHPLMWIQPVMWSLPVRRSKNVNLRLK